MSDDRKQVAIYTDGACMGNPGPGGYGVVLLYGQHRREMSGGVRRTTNNRVVVHPTYQLGRSAQTSPLQFD